MQWTRRRAQTNGADADGEVVWSWRPDAGVKFAAEAIRWSDGGKKARSPGRARRKPLKPLRAGMPGDPGATVVTTLVCYQTTAHEAAGALGTRHSPRPLFWAKDSCTTRAHRAARMRKRGSHLVVVQSFSDPHGEERVFARLEPRGARGPSFETRPEGRSSSDNGEAVTRG
jgi:hypothetical protein